MHLSLLCPHSDVLLCRPFSMLQLPKMDLILTENRGWGVMAAAPIPKGAFIVEYAGRPFRGTAHVKGQI